MCGCPVQGHLGPLTVGLGGGMPACLQPQPLPHKMVLLLWWHLQVSPPRPHGTRGFWLVFPGFLWVIRCGCESPSWLLASTAQRPVLTFPCLCA